MLAGQTILCFAPDPWAGLWRNRHQIMTRLAERNTVVYIEPRRYLWQTLRELRGGKLGWQELRAPRLRQDRRGLYIYRDPVYAPYAGRLSGGPLTAAIRRRALRGALAALGAASPILWLLRPFHADQIGQYGEKLVVYHVTDEYSGFPTIGDKAGFAAAEEALLRQADVVIVTSPALHSSKGRFNDHTFLVPNGVDFAGFAAALAGTRPASAQGDDLAALPRPRIGYVGALNEKVDFGLLADLAAAQPAWQFVLVGALDLTGQPHKADRLKALPNVRWVGRVPVEQVPHAIAALDVCLLPYERNAWTAAIDSLKLYEYLACGRPVVATAVPAVQAFSHLVRVGDSAADFAAQIQLALASDSAAAVAARKAAVAPHTWDARVAQIETILHAALESKQHA